MSDEPKNGQRVFGTDGKPSLTPDEARAEISAGRMTTQEATARLMDPANLPLSPYPRSAGAATPPTDVRSEARRRLEASAGLVFDVVQHLVDYRIMSELGRDRVRDSRESRRVGELRRRFAVAMINFAREVVRASRPTRRRSGI